jgi:drug/metabolite transporter (DMT)-like permease
MDSNTYPYLLALGSSLCFALASLVFTEVARKVSPLWMNATKSGLALVCFTFVVLVFDLWIWPQSYWTIAALFVSGIIGLAIGDIFLLTAYRRIGASRTLMLFGFQPLFMGAAGHFFFSQTMTWQRSLAVVFALLCLFTVSWEKYRSEGHWELKGLLAALAGVVLDNVGLILSRWAFDTTPDLHPMQANMIRCLGATVFFTAAFRLFSVQPGFREGWVRLSVSWRFWTVIASVFGTFFSLFLYLSAVRVGHLASLASVGLAGPLFAAMGECVWHRHWPSRYLVLAFLWFVIGFALVL